MTNQLIKIDISEEDAEDLKNGATFEWTFQDQNGKDIDVELYGSANVIECEECDISIIEGDEQTSKHNDDMILCEECADKENEPLIADDDGKTLKTYNE